MKHQKTQAHLTAQDIHVGIGAAVTDDGVVDAVIFAFENWGLTNHRPPESDERFVVAIPTTIEHLRWLQSACGQIADFLETGERPESARPME